MTSKHQHEKGTILVAALLVLLLMNLLAIGLVQSSVKETRTASYQSMENKTFQMTESCNRSAITWLEDQIRPSENIPYEIEEADIDFMLVGGEDEIITNQLAGYSYNCSVEDLISKSVSARDEGTGREVGTYSGYGQTGDMAPLFFYQIDSTGRGPKNSLRNTYMIVSVEY